MRKLIFSCSLLLTAVTLFGLDTVTLQQGLNSYSGCTDTYIEEFQAVPYGNLDSLSAVLGC